MIAVNQVYKCDHCGNIVEVLTAGGGELVCCGDPMKLQEEKAADSSTEKHVPVIEKIDGGFKVTVGSTLHPMTEEHSIQWIELIADGKVYRQNLKPGDAPVAEFCVEASEVSAREYCNLHGLWKA
ncbi:MULTISPECIES: desulfoferrodoxin [unclassified Oceanispirochaeta]|uniref:desulfoferrodoxin n=1 Tax=unclassified Oceanispirochaeta TaxID=2635722 RepID=UPI000E09DA57|nr:MULTISPECIES: desulfoferrodoxin [unclassified Oceanispirochaeta]MBF9018077.1 desulfoferrodoxin [Oceanispirochaeta sp. M2]NPD73842.1 desulfoferrodoxin [Oceanispirochaeta sp. M1]RDG30304.1 desulfoferrodoxin [Oceanispirochaeta sp. M1]